jgi:glycosyltransferase involved in cell wall biosynthesis
VASRRGEDHDPNSSQLERHQDGVRTNAPDIKIRVGTVSGGKINRTFSWPHGPLESLEVDGPVKRKDVTRNSLTGVREMGAADGPKSSEREWHRGGQRATRLLGMRDPMDIAPIQSQFRPSQAKKCWMVVGMFELPEGNAAAQRSLVTAKMLLNAGLNVRLVGSDRRLSLGDSAIPIGSTIDGLEMWHLPYPRTAAQWLRRFASDAYCDQILRLGRLDGVILYNLPYLLQRSIVAKCSSLRIPVVQEVTDWPHWRARAFPWGLFSYVDGWWRIRRYRAMDHWAVCASVNIAEALDPLRKRSVVVPTCIDTLDEKWRARESDLELPECTFAFAGDPGPSNEKERLDWLIRGVLELNSRGVRCTLRIAGPHTNRFRGLLGDAPEEIRSAVVFHGEIEHRGVPALLRRSRFSALVRPETRVAIHGFPTKLGESLACGTPVVATPVGQVASFMAGQGFGIVARSVSYQATLEALGRAATMPRETSDSMRRAALAYRGLDWRVHEHSLVQALRGAERLAHSD